MDVIQIIAIGCDM